MIFVLYHNLITKSPTGIPVFIIGFYINVSSDYKLIKLKQKHSTYVIPTGYVLPIADLRVNILFHSLVICILLHFSHYFIEDFVNIIYLNTNIYFIFHYFYIYLFYSICFKYYVFLLYEIYKQTITYHIILL